VHVRCEDGRHQVVAMMTHRDAECEFIFKPTNDEREMRCKLRTFALLEDVADDA